MDDKDAPPPNPFGPYGLAPPKPAEKIPFFVYLIELPSDEDLYDERSEADLLKEMLSLHGVPVVARRVISLKKFCDALGEGLIEAVKTCPGLFPVLHISGHGNSDGIGCADGSFVTWDQLQKFLIPINKAIGDLLIVCLSCCEGLNGIQMAMDADEKADYPFFALVASTGEPGWSDAAVAFITFYHHVAKRTGIKEAVRLMNLSAGVSDFLLVPGTKARQDFLDLMKRNVKQVAQQLRDLVDNPVAPASAEAPPPTEAKEGAPK